MTSYDRESEVSVAGQVNRRLGQLLGYRDMSSSQLTSCHQTLANITGYEIICTRDKQKYTVNLFYEIKYLTHKYSPTLLMKFTLLTGL